MAGEFFASGLDGKRAEKLQTEAENIQHRKFNG
jgi:hypothetical protein